MFREIAAQHELDLPRGPRTSSCSALFRRLFASIELSGIEKVAEYAKRHPIVLVPSHRSYFDFLIALAAASTRTTWCRRTSRRARTWPSGPSASCSAARAPSSCAAPSTTRSTRRCFAPTSRTWCARASRRSSSSRAARSRTGKTLAPRLGMLAWDVEAFLASAPARPLLRADRDHLRAAGRGGRDGRRARGRREAGGERARPGARAEVPARRFGSVFVNFGEPISLAEALGDRRARFARRGDRATRRSKRALRRASSATHRRAHQLGDGRRTPRRSRRARCSARRDAGCSARELVAAHAARSSTCCGSQDVRLTPALLRDEPASSTSRSRRCCAAT